MNLKHPTDVRRLHLEVIHVQHARVNRALAAETARYGAGQSNLNGNAQVELDDHRIPPVLLTRAGHDTAATRQLRARTSGEGFRASSSPANIK
jgi:hypothetical protein